jgi:hypothetical protein
MYASFNPSGMKIVGAVTGIIVKIVVWVVLKLTDNVLKNCDWN